MSECVLCKLLLITNIPTIRKFTILYFLKMVFKNFLDTPFHQFYSIKLFFKIRVPTCKKINTVFIYNTLHNIGVSCLLDNVFS